MIAPRQSKLVAVVGGSGAGKSWLVARLCELLGESAGAMALDDFYLDRSHLSPEERAQLNFDLPSAIDWAAAEEALQACRAGRLRQLPRYDFATQCRASVRVWTPRPIVFVDGLWLLRSPAIRELFDLKIYVDAPLNLRRTRRLARDQAERGYASREIIRRFSTQVTPMHTRYVAPQKNWADLVLTQPFEETPVSELARRLWRLLEDTAPMPPWMHETFRAELTARLVHHELCH